MRAPKVLPVAEQHALAFELCPAKTFDSESGVLVGRSVFNHCQIVGEVARELIRRQPQKIVKALYPMDAHFAAAAHDIGKISPTFVEKLRRACEPSLCTVKHIPGVNPQLESLWGGHAGVSQLTAKALDAPKFVPEILGQHHGFSPALSGHRAIDEQFGGLPWQTERIKLVEALKQSLRADWPQVINLPQARVVAGLTSVADWIGSGKYFEDPNQPWEQSISSALDDAGFVPPEYLADLTFFDVFGFSPRTEQGAFIDAVRGGGVSLASRTSRKSLGSSPRPWGCFSILIIDLI